MRDSQRQKVYSSESNWRNEEWAEWGDDPAVQTVDIAEAVEILSKLSKQFDVPPVHIRINRRIKAFGAWYKIFPEPLIEMPLPTTSIKTLLHEFAHHLKAHRTEGSFGFSPHGGAFTYAMIDVVWFYLGAESAKSLIAAYRERNVLIGEDEERERYDKNLTNSIAATQRASKRHNEEGTVYIAKVEFLRTEETRYLQLSGGYYDPITPSRHRAKAWRKAATAEKHVKGWSGTGRKVEVIETDGYFDKYEGWMAY